MYIPLAMKLCRKQMKGNEEHLIGPLHVLGIQLEGSLGRGMAKASG